MRGGSIPFAEEIDPQPEDRQSQPLPHMHSHRHHRPFSVATRDKQSPISSAASQNYGHEEEHTSSGARLVGSHGDKGRERDTCLGREEDETRRTGSVRGSDTRPRKRGMAL